MNYQMSPLNNKKIILGVCGSIAAYKSAYLLRELQRKGSEVKVVMTPSAAKFVAPLTFSTLSNNQVFVDMFSNEGVSIQHVNLGLWADAMLVAPILQLRPLRNLLMVLLITCLLRLRWLLVHRSSLHRQWMSICTFILLLQTISPS